MAFQLIDNEWDLNRSGAAGAIRKVLKGTYKLTE